MNYAKTHESFLCIIAIHNLLLNKKITFLVMIAFYYRKIITELLFLMNFKLLNSHFLHFVSVTFQLFNLRMPNVAGRGERISSDFTYGSKNAVGWSLSFFKPLFFSPHHKLVPFNG